MSKINEAFVIYFVKLSTCIITNVQTQRDFRFDAVVRFIWLPVAITFRREPEKRSQPM